MRTTIELDVDTAKAVEQLRVEEGRGLSEAVNELIRRGLLQREQAADQRYVHRSQTMGLRIDVSNVADALEILEGPDSR